MMMFTNGYGYVEEGEPTDKQVEMQDAIDNGIAEAVGTMIDFYSEAVRGVKIPEYEHDIAKITQVRELIQDLYGLPDVY